MRTILISGASRGIGKSIAERCLNDGHNVSIGLRDLNSVKGSNLDEQNNKNKKILVNQYDAKSTKKAQAWVENTKKCFGKIDTVIHCAGIFKRTNLNFECGEEKDINELLQVNLMGPWILTRAAWRYLIENNNSRIIVLVSMSGKRSKSSLAGYTASKFALMGLCQTIRNEGWAEGIRTTAICPGWVNTDMSNEIVTMERKNLTQPHDIASIVSNLLELPNSCIPFEIPINCNLEKI